jgi:hypothetical protein
VGRADVRFVSGPGSTKLKETKSYIDPAAQTVTSSTGELKLDYGKGVLVLNSPKAQGMSGLLSTIGSTETRDLSVISKMELGNIVAVPLDDQPLASSGKILVQVMSEERESDRQTEETAPNIKKLVRLGRNPWMLKEFEGTVRFKRADASELKVKALDANGYAKADAGTAAEIKLLPDTLYYFISK